MNEINFREARMRTKQGELVPISICGSSTGCHCSKRKYRLSDFDELGPGVNLYFKMLKYFSMCFFIFCLISIPSVLIFISGDGYANEDMKAASIIMKTSLGNMDEFETNTCSFTMIGDSYPAASSMKFKCSGSNYLIKEFKQLGLAYKEKTCTGLGKKMSVSTLDRCTVGQMSSTEKEKAIIATFNTNCVGKAECEMPLDYKSMFTDECNQEIVRRKAGKIFYGPPKVFGMAVCEKDGVMMAGKKLTRQTASLIIVGTDILISVIFTISLFRLRWYEDLVERDR